MGNSQGGVPGARRATRRAGVAFTAGVWAALAFSPAAHAGSPFTLFESGQPRPLALAPGGKLLFATNTPDNRLEVFRVKPGGLTHRASIPVGLEPVAVAARNDHEVWVVNHLSDSVSVVAIDDQGRGEVVRTLLVGDEPRDIVFAGPGRRRAFITAAHRGQNVPFDPQLTTPGVGRADVWVFDGDELGGSLGGEPLNIITLFGDTPRALAVTPDGSRVYAAAFHSGNRTTIIHEGHVPDGGQEAGGLPSPVENHAGVRAPEVGLIVRFDGADWVDELGRSWNDKVRLSLPDKDVFAIDATANPPAQVGGDAGSFAGVGTVLFNMAVNPKNGKVYVANTEAFNEVRFEGPGVLTGSSVRGHLHESRITVLGPGGVAPRHLNKHIDYSSCCAPVPNDESEKSLAFPQGIAVDPGGQTLYVAALGSSKVGVFKTAEIEADTFVPGAANQISVSGGGPTGLVLDGDGRRLYVLTRFDNAISVVDTKQRREVAHVPMFSPEPESVVRGRRFLYDARLSSSHGDSACASCHVFGDFDSLAWDLGNPDGDVLSNPGPFVGDPVLNPFDFHPMKGPMVTQSLRGMANHGPMHWRGDRTGGNDEPSAQPDGGSFDENAGFLKFNVAFPGLLGRDGEIAAADMQAFADFILQITYPPNPVRNLDNSLTPDQQEGKDFFTGPASLPVQGLGNLSCEGCHRIDLGANPGDDRPGFFGGDGRSSFDFISQTLKVPHLRNLYQKVGMFGLAELPFITAGDNGHLGDQVRGFGFTHDGSFDTVFRFMSLVTFSDSQPGQPDAFPTGPEGNELRRKVEAFQLAFDSNLAPIVGQQATLSGETEASAPARMGLLVERAERGECDLVARMRLFGHDLGFAYVGGDQFVVNRQGLPPVGDALLRRAALAGRAALTYTCAPPGSGIRVGVDRDSDGAWDGDEEDAGTDPADPSSTPLARPAR